MDIFVLYKRIMKPLLIKNKLENNSIYLSHYEAPYFSRPLHYHSQLELTLIVKSSGIRFLGNSIENFKDGDLILVGENVPHVWRNEEFYYKPDSHLSAKAIGVFFDENLFGGHLAQLNEFKAINKLIKEAKRGVRIDGVLKEEISKNMKQLIDLSPTERVISVINILHKISISNEIVYLMDEAGDYPKRHLDKLNDIYDYLLTNISQKISLEEVAEKTSFHPVSLGRFVKQHTGKTFVQILNEMRINMACKLLKEPGSEIATIINQTGFNNVSNFIRRFKEVTGETPLRYRKKE